MGEISISDLTCTHYTTSSFNMVIDTDISELYTEPAYIVKNISDFFNTYNMIKSDIPSTGSNSMEIFANDIEDFYSSSTVIYTPNNNTWNEIDNIVNGYNQLLIDSASLAAQLDFLRDQLNTNIDNIVPINNGSFENWTTGSIDDWMVSSASYLQVQGYSSSTAIRVIRNTPTSEWSGGIYTDNYWINAFQTHKISGYFRAPENIDGRVFVGDTNKPNNISSDNYSWQYSQRLHNTTPLSWSYFEYEFNPVPNIYYDNFGCAMNIYLYPGISGESNPTDWVEYDNIKIERLNEINNNQTGQGSPSYQPSPVLLTPANNAEFEIFRDVLLTWEPVSNTNYYILQISTNELFNDAQEYQVVLANMDLSFDEYGTHYWRVKSVSTGGVDGYWSDNRTFIITP